MPTDYSQFIKAYAHNDIDYDTLATALSRSVEEDPACLSAILSRLEEIKTAKPADLPLIQKLQKQLRDYSPAADISEPPSAGEQTVIIGATGHPVEEQVKTIIASASQEPMDDSATVVRSAVDDGTLVQPTPVQPTPAQPRPLKPGPIQPQPSLPDEETRIQLPDESTRVSANTTVVQPEEEPKAAQQLQPGSVIKKRFILENLLGEGGMGRVFKARDLRKEEARDRNPYLAIKVLNDSFKDHPQAFIALQREAKKAQTLAHPNIVNVYDFDRDGDTVYMTMEYLEGNSLDRMIRQRQPRPFDKSEAIKIVQGICLGLSYAHKRNIIHSDLKPGNVFVTGDGEVKIFDFGIARAVKSQDVGGEKTLFDAGSLGGLTPAYASCEMFEGEEPDVRDDIYALACIAYELLGGKHPFNKTPAIKAKQNNLIPDKLPHLSHRQNKTLCAGLAFDRQSRTPTVDKFVQELTTRFSKKQKITAVVTSIALLAGIISYEPLTGYFRRAQIEDYVAQFHSGNTAVIQTGLKKLAKMPHTIRDEILAAAKDPLIAYYEKQAFARIDVDKGLVDFNGAYRYLNIANALYPDSAQITADKKKLEQRKQQLTSELTTRLNFHLQQGNLLPDDSSDDLLDVLALAAKIDPNHPLLSDKRIAAAYAEQAQKAAGQWDFDKAQQLLNVAQQVVPGNPSLKSLRQSINTQQQEYLAKQEKIAGQLDAKTLRRNVETLLDKPFGSVNWSGELLTYIRQLQELLPPGDQWLKDSKRNIALYHLKRAENLRMQAKFGEARSTLQLAEKFDPQITGLEQEKSALKQAETRTMQQQQLLAQKQQISTLKQQLLREANNNRLEKAEQLLAKLSIELDKNDPFLKQEAPQAIAAAYLRLSQNALQRGETTSAAQWAAAGLKFEPDNKELASLIAKLPKKTSDACELKYAGYGKRLTCYDTLTIGAGAETKGPALVVVPAEKDGKPFAMGKYEVSIADFNLYCQATKNCPARGGNSDLPVTNISFDDINRYLQWLSAQTGVHYRLPTKAEWMHAAKAAAQPAGKDFNCRVMIGDNIVKGNALLTVKSGKMNSWGLMNYIGNAQELVFNPPDQLIAMGGAYQDPLAQCNIAFNRKHSGNPDPITGFRVLREM